MFYRTPPFEKRMTHSYLKKCPAPEQARESLYYSFHPQLLNWYCICLGQTVTVCPAKERSDCLKEI